jgi:hypothetical protein
MFASGRLGGNTSTFTGSRLSGAFGGSRFGAGRSTIAQPRFGLGGFGDRFGFRGRGFGCWGCGFGFGFGGFGFGWGWGFGPWWWDPWLSPWWYDPWWGPVGYTYPYYDYPPPPPDYNYPPPYGPDDNNSSSISPSLDQNPIAPPAEGQANQGSGPGPDTANVAESRPTVLLYLKDGTTFAATDYWLADGRLHYRVSYGGESTLDPNDLDWQRTVNENAKRGVQFKLTPQPALSTPLPATSEGTATSKAA